jgi:hypothetical protein
VLVNVAVRTDTLASFHFEAAAVDRLRGRLDDALAELVIHQEYAE